MQEKHLHELVAELEATVAPHIGKSATAIDLCAIIKKVLEILDGLKKIPIIGPMLAKILDPIIALLKLVQQALGCAA